MRFYYIYVVFRGINIKIFKYVSVYLYAAAVYIKILHFMD